MRGSRSSSRWSGSRARRQSIQVSFRVGRTEITTTSDDIAAGEPVRLYLRPEDRILEDSGPLEQRPNRLIGRVVHLDFHGTYCLANLEVEAFDGQCMLLYCSLN